MFDKRLIHMINKGRCFILVGSGLSCELVDLPHIAHNVFCNSNKDKITRFGGHHIGLYFHQR